eukprot:SAG22_NODE_844_length_6872_cov_10.004577_3_plen_371_part_00
MDLTTVSGHQLDAWRARPGPLAGFVGGLTARPVWLAGLRSLALCCRAERRELLDAALPHGLVVQLLEALVNSPAPQLTDLSIAGPEAGCISVIGRLPSLRSCCMSIELLDNTALASLARLRTVSALELRLQMPSNTDRLTAARLALNMATLRHALWQLPNLQELKIDGASHGYTINVPFSLASGTLRSLSVSTRKTTLKLTMMPMYGGGQALPALEELYLSDTWTGRARIANVCIGACRRCPELRRLVMYTDETIYNNLEQQVWNQCMAHCLQTVPDCEMIVDHSGRNLAWHTGVCPEYRAAGVRTLEQWLSRIRQEANTAGAVQWPSTPMIELLSTAAAAAEAVAGEHMLQQLAQQVDTIDTNARNGWH